MSYRLTLTDDMATKSFDLLEIPIIDKDIEGASDNTVLTGDVFTDYMYLRKQYEQGWVKMFAGDYADLRGFYTRQWTNAKYPYLMLEDLRRFEPYVIYEEKIATGEYILVQDQGAESPILDFSLLGNATQQTYSGKNLFNKAATVVNSSNCTYTYGNGVFTITNTNANNPQITLAVSLPVGSYVLNSASFLSRTTQLRGANAAVASLGSSYQNATFTITSAVDSIRFNWLSTTDTITLNLNTLQIEAGSTATDYEPYVGGMPSPNPDYPQDIQVVTGDNTVKITGKNLLDINATPTLGHTTVSVNGQSITVTTDNQATTARATLPLTYEANREMTISFDATCLTYEPTATNTVLVYMRTNGQSDATTQTSLSKTVGTTTHYTRTITPNNNTKDLWLYLKSSNVAGVVSYRFDNIQVEYGSETDYEPYQGQSYTIDLGNLELAKIGDYQDYIWNDDGTWKIHRVIGKQVIDANTSITLASSYSNIEYAQVMKPTDAIFYNVSTNYQGTSQASFATIQTNVSGGYNNADFIGKYILQATALRYFVGFAKNTGLDAIKTTLNGGVLYYALATPTDTEITDGGLLAQLNAILVSTLYSGTNNIFLTANGTAQGEMKIEYYKTTVDTRPLRLVSNQAVRLKLTDGGVIDECGSRQNVKLTMRQTVND